MYKKVLVAIDGSEYSQKVILTAISIQKQIGCKVQIFYSIKHPISTLMPLYNSAIPYEGGIYKTTGIDFKSLEKEWNEAGQKILKEAEKEFEDASIDKAIVESKLILDKSPTDYAVEMVNDEGFDLVIVGNKGYHSKIKDFFLGSVAQKILKHAPCDVLIVK
ncbi:MAG: universal stress protein [Promethearchaeota archaeon]